MVNDDGTMMRQGMQPHLPTKEGLILMTIADLIALPPRQERPSRRTSSRSPTACCFEGEARLPTAHGEFTIRGYRDARTGDEHVALVGAPEGVVPIVRVHSECLTGDALRLAALRLRPAARRSDRAGCRPRAARSST